MSFNSQIHGSGITVWPFRLAVKASASGPNRALVLTLMNSKFQREKLLFASWFLTWQITRVNKSEISQPIFQRASSGRLFIVFTLGFSSPSNLHKRGRKTTEPPFSQTLSNPFIIQDLRAAVETQPQCCAYPRCAWQSKQFHLLALQSACGDR